ncbi:MAG: hypothetical protein DKM50_11435 [Candidatus Margulisiibacteriota bacterium]|nr:MAG: hypothetical protein A2X43_12075 [Candidatus Margulisbacteria bacterium GWD2_39_127]OGI03193.1 MAG: hypothetical protein A2X42_11315 [Candidatus Margulisbacteria bacterium GWF2_38_17]OGI11217.1 MAG: hypothetical protein A2X41_03740 [Candidatus Margulisbacteria bacterium GWE2_39_32]PZM78568.1 MAG: hypothetical protein DKM50_11435 [Candidatus Margulisiibacteriota bacterium]HAR63865.1 hypothetical protein [Candidatus Margulisiibacteriota bacterium]
MLNDFIKKTLLLGIGSISLTKKKVEDIVDDLVKQGEVEAKDRMKVVDTIMQEGEQINKDNMRRIKDIIKNDVRDLGLVTREEFDEVKRRLEVLELVNLDLQDLRERIELLEDLAKSESK